MKTIHRAVVVGVLALAGLACGSSSSGTAGTGGAGGTASTTTTASGSTTTSASTGLTTSSQTTAASSTSAASTTSGSSGDPLDMARQACIDKINALRATKGLPAYGRWGSAEMCVDQEATSDEKSSSPHGAWKSGMYPCNGSGQNECLGGGSQGITGCLDQMWAEKDQPGCAGCDACNGGYDPNCPNCDFYGTNTGNVCGHYVNMSAKYFSQAACGFSSLGGWAAINFQ